jgi:hypothetical protein
MFVISIKFRIIHACKSLNKKLTTQERRIRKKCDGFAKNATDEDDDRTRATKRLLFDLMRTQNPGNVCFLLSVQSRESYVILDLEVPAGSFLAVRETFSGDDGDRVSYHISFTALYRPPIQCQERKSRASKSFKECHCVSIP